MEHVAGQQCIHEDLLGLAFRISPHAFFQVARIAGAMCVGPAAGSGPGQRWGLSLPRFGEAVQTQESQGGKAVVPAPLENLSVCVGAGLWGVFDTCCCCGGPTGTQ